MYWTKSPGAGGRIEVEEDFLVEEVPLGKFLSKFSRTEGGVKLQSRYSLVLLKKKNMTTADAVRFIAKKFNLKRNDIGYAGLKDKFAVTTQYITVRGKIEPFDNERISISFVGYTDRMMQVGELEGNKFTIRLRNCDAKKARAVVDEISERGLPNYFGMQRFGMRKNNHIIGRLILQARYDKALEIINENEKIAAFQDLGKKKLKFFIHAYQSYVFNCVLDKYISKHHKPFYGDFPVFGSNTRLGKNVADNEISKILKKDKLTAADFSIRDLQINCIGSSRPAFVKIKDASCKEDNGTVLQFTLPKGSYATVLIREVAKGTFNK